MTSKVMICGAGFLGSFIAKTLLRSHRVVLASRNPERSHAYIQKSMLESDRQRLLPPVVVDITNTATLPAAFKNVDVVVSLVGLMHGTPADFERVQWKGAENVARAAQDAGAKLIHISAIGADLNSAIPYERTKFLGEQAVFSACPHATVIRPSIVFGPGDSFFARFAKLSLILPFVPVFAGGQTLFQPVYAGDIANAIEIICQQRSSVKNVVDGKILEAGGPDIVTYRQIMELVLRYTGRWRPIVSLPFAVGMMQAAVMEKLPPNIFTLTRAQVDQLRKNNIVNPSPAVNEVSFKDFVEQFSSRPLTSLHEILPTYL